MGVFDRLKNVAKGTASQAVGDLERANPAAVYEAALTNAVARIAEHKDAAAALAAQRNRLTDKLAVLESDREDCRKALREALDDEDEDLALVLAARDAELVRAVDDVTRERDEVAAAVEETVRGLRELESQTKALKRERDSALAQLATAEAAIEIHDTASGFSDSAQARGLDSVRSRINTLNEQAHEGWLDEERNSVRGRAAALGRKAAEADAKEELDRLKAAMAARKVGAAPAAPGSEDDPDDAPGGGESDEDTPSGPPKRRL